MPAAVMYILATYRWKKIETVNKNLTDDQKYQSTIDNDGWNRIESNKKPHHHINTMNSWKKSLQRSWSNDHNTNQISFGKCLFVIDGCNGVISIVM